MKKIFRFLKKLFAHSEYVLDTVQDVVLFLDLLWDETPENIRETRFGRITEYAIDYAKSKDFENLAALLDSLKEKEALREMAKYIIKRLFPNLESDKINLMIEYAVQILKKRSE